MAFTQQQLEDAYKQMQDERAVESKFAYLAAKKLSVVLGINVDYLNYSNSSCIARYINSLSPYPIIYEVYFELCEYDNWQHYINLLNNLGCGMKNSMIVGKGICWNGEYDLTNDPDFANANQKIHRITIGKDIHNSDF